MTVRARDERSPAGPVLCGVLIACAIVLLSVLCAGLLWRNWYG